MLTIILLVSAYLITTVVKDGHNMWAGDFALYVNQAKHLSDGNLQEAYEINKYSMENSIKEIGPYLYPNGFPILLAPIYQLFGLDFLKMKYLCAFFFLLSIPVLYKVFKSNFNSIIYAFIIIILIAFNPHFIIFCDMILSDLPFFFLVILSFYLMTLKNSVINQVFLASSIFYAYFTRDIGIVLLPTLLAYQIMNKEKYTSRKWIKYIPYALFVSAYAIIKLIFPSGGANHLEMFFSGITIDRIFGNFEYYMLLLSDVFFFGSLDFVLGLALMLFTIFGAVISFKQYAYFIVFIVLYFAVLLVWPSVQGVRFLFPLLPLFVFFGLKGIQFLIEKIKVKPIIAYGFMCIYLLVFSVNSFGQINEYAKLNTNEVDIPETREVYEYLSSEIPSDATIGFIKPRVLWLFTDVKCIDTDLDHFDNSVADFLLLHNGSDTGNYQIEKQFKHFVLLKK
ncbi:MAG: hypothetical protein R2780_02055 [Crocinitomicaceae bacterium]|nr:hypothetical protein [Crocinitomicaceae bacterium]